MKIIAHRGHWFDPKQQNTLNALVSGLTLFDGVETDIRDHHGDLVISHDPPLPGAQPIKLKTFLDSYTKVNSKAQLCLNIKADGLSSEIKHLLNRYEIENVVCFDMSFPEQLRYVQCGIPTLTRFSDLEPLAEKTNGTVGLWADSFYSNCVTPELIEKVSKLGLESIYLVSPELHDRSHLQVWRMWKTIFGEYDNVFVCTDNCQSAMEYFSK